MWAKVEGASVTEIIPRPKPMTIGDIQYPRNIFSMWGAADLKGIGIHPVTLNTTNRKDSQYYVNTDITYTWDSENETVTGTYGTATAKPLADSGSGVTLIKGLKTVKKESVNDSASGLLKKYDWYTLRAASGGTAIPSAVATYQAAVRTKANQHTTAIDAAASVDALAALTFDWPSEPS